MIMGAIDRILRRGRLQDGGYKPLMKRLEAAMLAACRAAGAAAWYVPDDFLVLGPELVPSGAFDSGAGWTQGSGWAISGGKLTATAAATGSNSVINAGLVAGKSYRVAYDIDSISAGATTPIANGAVSTQQTTIGQKVSVITPAGNSGNVGLNSSSATALTATIDNFSVREILSAKDFQDSSGTLPSYLGGTVVLLTDRSYGLASIKIAGDLSGFSSVGGSPNVSVSPLAFTTTTSFLGVTIPCVVGRWYRVAATGNTTSDSFSINTYDTSPSRTEIKTGFGECVFRADRPFIYLRHNNAGTTSLTSLLVEEIPGNHVTQATAGNRPNVSRIPRKLGPELAAFDGTTAGWVVLGASVSTASGKLRVSNSGTFGRAGQLLPLVAGKSYQITATSEFVSGTNDNSFVSASTAIDAISYAASAQAAAGAKSLVFTATGPSYVRLNSADATDVNDWSAISVREVLEWSNVLTFDGSNDSLATAASVIGSNLSQPYTMIAWGVVGSLGASRTLIGDSARVLRVYQDGAVGAAHAGIGEVRSTAGAVSSGQPAIIESTYDGVSVAKCYLLGVQVGANHSLPGPSVAATATSVGQRGNSTEFFNSTLGGAVVCPAVMTDAQRLAVRKFAAAQMGITL